MKYIGIFLCVFSFALFGLGHPGSGLLCIIVGCVLILHKSEEDYRRERERWTYVPRRAMEEDVIDEETGEVLFDWAEDGPSEWRHVSKNA